MTDKISSFVIPFVPVKHRVRTTKNGHVYNDPRNAEVEATIASLYEGEMLEGPVCVSVTVYGKLPSATPKKFDSLPNVRKPDIDNIAKSVLDGLNGVAYEDDRQVVQLFVTKRKRERIDHPWCLVMVCEANDD